MAETVNFIIDNDYQLVVGNVPYAIQNGAQPTIEVVFSDAAPAVDLKGHPLREIHGVITAWGEGNIWARTNGTADGLLIVTV